jgi:hypothetical protein
MLYYKIVNSVVVSVNNKPIIDDNAEQVYINLSLSEMFGTGTGGKGKYEISKHQNRIKGINGEYELLEISNNRYVSLELWRLYDVHDEDNNNVIVFEDMGDFYKIDFITPYQFQNDPMLNEFWQTYQW